MAHILNGLKASPGVAIGRAWIFAPKTPIIQMQAITDSQIDSEIQAFKNAQDQVEAHLQGLYERVLKAQGETEAEIFSSHIELLRDEEFENDTIDLIKSEHYSATRAVKEYLDQAAAAMRALDDPYLRERAAEFEDLQNNLLLSLNGMPFASLGSAPKDSIIFAEDLTPSQTAQIDINNVHGFVLSGGGLTSHVAILARNIGLPAIMGIEGLLEQVKDDSSIVMDGSTGEVILDASDSDVATFTKRKEEQARLEEEYQKIYNEKAITTDGVHVKMYSNIGSPKDLHRIDDNNSEGVGLFRSEFLFMEASAAPSEEAQYKAYREVVEYLQGKTVVLRLADIGGDKPLSYLQFPKEENPFLGWRGVRIYDEVRNILDSQVRASLRAATHGNLWVMVPMITSVDELIFIREEYKKQAQALKAQGVEVNENLKIGVMIETPAAALIAPQLAKYADFFSIGTNDLTQYTLATDRGNTKISKLYNELHPAVLRLMKMTADAAHNAGIEVGVCGEMGGRVDAAPLLVGMGFDELSISGKGVAAMKYRIRQLNAKACREMLEKAITLDDVAQVEALLATIA